MTPEEARPLLAKLDAKEFGSGRQPSDREADDRSGRFWLVTTDGVRLAVKVALLTGRPLLVEGPSGAGKSSLAKALARTLRWRYYEQVITSDTRIEDLIGKVDHIGRLHEAEVAAREVPPRRLDRDMTAFVEPGVLWWAYDPDSAASLGAGRDDPGEGDNDGGAVVLLDEIDKAEPDLPNNLLVPLGDRELRITGRRDPVVVNRPAPPLVVITSNGERELPPAFLRRCLAVELEYPAGPELKRIAAGHVPSSDVLADEVIRRFVPGEKNTTMSPAEFVDAVRAARGLGLRDPADRAEQALWDQVTELLRTSQQRRR